ncbi:MAG: hypothetical protein ACNA77_02285 [Opitutales bacterium]
MNLRILLSTLFALSAFGSGLFGQQQADDRLREALRSTTMQLRTAQEERAVADAARELAESEVGTLRTRLEELVKQSAADQTAAQANLANVNEQLAAKEAEALRLAESLRLAKNQNEALEKAMAEEQKSFKEKEVEAVLLQREIARMKSLNRELYAIGEEILERFEEFSMGRAIAAREPFTRLVRVRLQEITQDYADELADKRIRLDDEKKPLAEEADDAL